MIKTSMELMIDIERDNIGLTFKLTCLNSWYLWIDEMGPMVSWSRVWRRAIRPLNEVFSLKKQIVPGY